MYTIRTKITKRKANIITMTIQIIMEPTKKIIRNQTKRTMIIITTLNTITTKLGIVKTITITKTKITPPAITTIKAIIIIITTMIIITKITMTITIRKGKTIKTLTIKSKIR